MVWKPQRMSASAGAASPVESHLPGSWRPGTGAERRRDHLVLRVDGRGQVGRSPLEGPLLIGSSQAPAPRYASGLSVTPDIDLAPARGISRRHARITYRDGDCWLLDLNSAAGTYHNERRLPPGVEVRIQVRDRIRVGDQQLVCLALPVEGALHEEDHRLSELVAEVWRPQGDEAVDEFGEPPDLLSVALARSAQDTMLGGAGRPKRGVGQTPSELASDHASPV